jgi:hypothetical protein
MNRIVSNVIPLTAFIVLAATLAVTESASAQGDCTQWDVSKGWYALQGSYQVKFLLRQTGTNSAGRRR